MIDLLHGRWQEFADLRTLADISIRRDGRVERLAGVLLLSAPASIRFEALTPWGQPFLLLAGDGRTVTLYHVADNRALVGPASAGATERWLGFALEPRELVAILAGYVLPIPDPDSAQLLRADGLGPSLRLTGPAGDQRIWLDPATGLVRQVELSRGGTPSRIAYGPRGAGGVPTSLALAALDGPLAVTVRYREPRLGTGPPPDLFTLRLPEHVEIQRFR